MFLTLKLYHFLNYNLNPNALPVNTGVDKQSATKAFQNTYTFN